MRLPAEDDDDDVDSLAAPVVELIGVVEDEDTKVGELAEVVERVAGEEEVVVVE